MKSRISFEGDSNDLILFQVLLGLFALLFYLLIKHEYESYVLSIAEGLSLMTIFFLSVIIIIRECGRVNE